MAPRLILTTLEIQVSMSRHDDILSDKSTAEIIILSNMSLDVERGLLSGTNFQTVG